MPAPTFGQKCLKGIKSFLGGVGDDEYAKRKRKACIKKHIDRWLAEDACPGTNGPQLQLAADSHCRMYHS